MMVKASSKQPKINRAEASMESHKITNNLNEEPHLSGAYIRSLVKHLTSIKPKDSLTANEKPPESVDSNGECIIDHNNMQQESPPPASPPVKKQVRRRRHTSKPYQERLLNMAEARREIVTALKFHRASMKQRETGGNHYPLQVEKSSTIATTSDLSTNYLDYHSSLSCSPPVPYYYLPVSGPPPLPPLNLENLDFTLPNQTLGLNLNFQDFINLDANLYHNPLSNYPTSSSSSSSSLSSSSSPSSSAAISLVNGETREIAAEEMVATTTTTSSSSSSSGAMMSGDLHHVIDEERMEEIKSLGEQHEMEWNDTVNSLMSVRWFKFLKNIEIEQEDGKFDFNDEINPFDQFPPCMDIDEIEGMDGEWLA